MAGKEFTSDDIAEFLDRVFYGTGKRGGGGKKKGDTWGSKGRKGHKQTEARVGQRENLIKRREEGKSPEDEVNGVLNFIAKSDEGEAAMPETTRYVEWLKSNINDPESLVLTEEEFGKWEQFTASVKAGGGGRQTSKNARGRTHLITGIRATAEEDRIRRR